MKEESNHQLAVGSVTLKDLEKLDIENNLLNQFNEWKRLPMLYKLALEELQNKIKLIKTELKLQDGYSPIEHIKVRIKEPKSIINKLERKGIEFTLDNILNHIHDIAGMRIVCAFVQDIYRLLDHFSHRDDIRIIEIKDYIANPKPNGYQSLHVIVEVPLILFEGTRWMKVEIQMRTLAMDFWASMEHIIFYKYDKQVPRHVVTELKEAAVAADKLDHQMLRLRDEILASAGEYYPQELQEVQEE
ncbi:GTP pyrophosphokinase family protein [Paenibacillus sp. FSL M7-1455]|uniref:GTP pyrophosphokinase n=2 Tax=Paenibacillus TaxID=44249 RepID=A0ABQ4M4D2_9BACL|nr:GTP pyrophosphokinase family protein [Paenibacillus cookii]KHF36063.1 GTP pyrophosphokinase YwaC [Paenibacillus sp. P1XP2]GIO70288.1 GTP pyrophosphokinase [Paenibacillus cookii]HWO52932.1 GTP pyrophosphokinase family protein [Paenibacillus cookii]